MAKNLFISLSREHVLCAEKEANSNALLLEKDFPVGYNMSPAEVFFRAFDASGTQYNIVYCTVKHPFFVLVPEILFDIQFMEQYLPGIDLGGQKIVYDKIMRNNIVCIYPVEEKWHNDLVHRYPNIIIRHHASVLVDYTIRNGFANQQPVVTLDLEDGIFYLCIVHKTELYLCNRFAFKAPEDVLYFLLYSLEQFEIMPSAAQLHVCGMVNENAASVVLLNEYFDNVVLDESPLSKATIFKNQAAFFHLDACV